MRNLKGFVMVISCMFLLSGAAHAQPVEITDWHDLQNMQNDPNADYVLANDLDASSPGYADFRSGAGFEPIRDFVGTFDGQNHTISGLHIYRPEEEAVGMFGSLPAPNDSTIENVRLADVDVTGYARVGGLVGYVQAVPGGLVRNCHVSGQVSGVVWVGGLAGYVFGDVEDPTPVRIRECSADVTVYYMGGEVGGLVGKSGGSIIDSYATGDVISVGEWTEYTDMVGGLVGFKDIGDVINCYATGNVSGGRLVGGLIGINGSGDVGYSYATGNVVSHRGEYDGGLIGQHYPSFGTVSFCFWNNHAGNPSYAYSTSGSTPGNDGCTAVMDDEPYFYDAGNPPMNNWDFTNVWKERPADHPLLLGSQPDPEPWGTASTLGTNHGPASDVANCILFLLAPIAGLLLWKRRSRTL